MTRIKISTRTRTNHKTISFRTRTNHKTISFRTRTNQKTFTHLASAATSRSVASGGTVGEAEVVAEAAGLLEGLREHLVLLDVVVGH